MSAPTRRKTPQFRVNACIIFIPIFFYTEALYEISILKEQVDVKKLTVQVTTIVSQTHLGKFYEEANIYKSVTSCEHGEPIITTHALRTLNTKQYSYKGLCTLEQFFLINILFSQHISNVYDFKDTVRSQIQSVKYLDQYLVTDFQNENITYIILECN